MSSMWTQMYPPKPMFTEKDLPDLSGKVSRYELTRFV